MEHNIDFCPGARPLGEFVTGADLTGESTVQNEARPNAKTLDAQIAGDEIQGASDLKLQRFEPLRF